MNRIPVQSSNVGSVGYDEHTQTLEVAFRANRAGVIVVWSYQPVSLEAYNEMMAPGSSVGWHVNQIKSSPVNATRMPDEAPAEVS